MNAQRAEIQELKRRAGRSPFTDRLSFDSNNAAKCPFHNGDNANMRLSEPEPGVWIATCFSGCIKNGGPQKWDAPAFVQQFDNVTFTEALQRLSGKHLIAAPTPIETAKAKPKAMTPAEWATWGRELTEKDIELFAASRTDKTAGFETFKALGCRVKDGCIGFPFRRTIYDEDTGVAQGQKFYVVKTRKLDGKEFSQENCISQAGFFNLDTVDIFDDLYIVEGEPDVAVMEEAGFRAVSVTTGGQRKFDPAGLEAISMASRIFLVGDQFDKYNPDDPGPECMDKLQVLLPAEKTFRIRFEKAHDVSALARKQGDGFQATIEELRDDSLVPWVQKTIPTVSKLSGQPKKWVVDKMFPYGGLTILCGKQGAKKSLFSLFAAHAISGSAQSFLGRNVGGGLKVPGMFFPDKKGDPPRQSSLAEMAFAVGANGADFFAGTHHYPVLYVDRENPESEISERRRRVGIMGNDNFHYWGDWEKAGATPEPDDPRLLEFATRQKGFIVFDSLQQWYGTDNENDNTAMGLKLKKFQRLARLGAGVLLLHHDNKYGDKFGKATWRGGTAIVSIPDMSIGAGASETDTDLVQLRPIRFRMCKPWEMDFKIHFGENYTIETVRDQAQSAAITEKQQVAQVAKAEESKRKEEDIELLVRLISENPKLEKTELEQLTKQAGRKIGRNRMEPLAALKGWKWNRETKWTKPATEAQELG